MDTLLKTVINPKFEPAVGNSWKVLLSGVGFIYTEQQDVSMRCGYGNLQHLCANVSCSAGDMY